jgi:hypothetical protein
MILKILIYNTMRDTAYHFAISSRAEKRNIFSNDPPVETKKISPSIMQYKVPALHLYCSSPTTSPYRP